MIDGGKTRNNLNSEKYTGKVIFLILLLYYIRTELCEGVKIHNVFGKRVLSVR